ncbi:MAG: Gfo/Idh/MocA family oxidoreductase [Candidatus Methanoperedens sp.]|nr:Gfo/Idh/MocA family oxidoreductase [Candidatus Methanoperedens sp.]
MVYKVGIIGCGQIASIFEEDAWREHPCTHAGAYDAVKRTRIVAAADISEERLDRFSKRWGGKVYTDYKEMLENEDLDIVSVTANTPYHSEMVIKAAKSGVKAIFCEKPIATCIAEADEMIQACDEQGVKLIINHTRRWHPFYQKAKELVNNGEIGELTSITGYFTSGLLIVGTHFFDTLRFIAGDAGWVIGSIERNQSGDPSGSGLIGFKSGIAGSVFGSSQKQYLIFEMDIQGTQGRICIKDNGTTFKLWTTNKEKKHIDFNVPGELVPRKISIEKKNSMIAAVSDVVASIENDRDGLCSGRDGKAALELALAFHESDRMGEKVELPLQDKILRIVSR